MTKVVHCKREEYDVYIGRPWADVGFHYGNIASNKPNTKAAILVETVEESVEAFRQWLQGTRYQDIEPERRQWILDHISELKDLTLGCWCRPYHVCHGDVLAELADTG